MPLAGWLLVQDKGLPVSYVLLAGLIGALGNVVGSWITYGISMAGGRPLLRKYGKVVPAMHTRKTHLRAFLLLPRATRRAGRGVGGRGRRHPCHGRAAARTRRQRGWQVSRFTFLAA